MSFLSALYLIGTAAVISPIVIHMIRRAPRDNFKFSTLRFLTSSPETVSKRSKIQHWLLLLLRALAILLIALAFARPYFTSEDKNAGEGKKAIVMFLVDRSASMNRKDVSEKLIKKLNERLDLIKETDLLEMKVYERISHGKFGIKNWLEWPANERKERAKRYFEQFKESDWAESNLSVSLIQAADAMDRSLDVYGGSSADIEVFTDSQAGEGLDELRSFSWPQRVNVIVHKIDASTENASVSLVNINAENQQVKVKVENPDQSRKLSLWLELKTGDIVASAEAMVLDPGTVRFHVFDLKALPKGTDKFTVQLSGDKEPYDNKIYCIIPKIEKKNILWLGQEKDGKGADFYFNVLCESRADLEVSFDEKELKNPQLKPELLVVNRALNEDELQPIQNYMNGGGTVLFLVNSPAQAGTLESLTGEKLIIKEVNAPDYYLLSGMRFDHWLFQPFSESKFKDFSTVFFWKVRELQLQENSSLSVLASLNEDIPAVLSKTVGKGELVLMTSGWGKDDSQLALNSKFIPFVNALVTASGRYRQNKLQYISGDPKVGLLTANKNAWKGQLPGFYDYVSNGETGKFALNLSPSESKMKLLENVDYEKAGIPFVKESVLKEHQMKRYEQETVAVGSEVKNKNIWRYLLLAAVVVLLIESVIAHTTHKKMEQAV